MNEEELKKKEEQQQQQQPAAKRGWRDVVKERNPELDLEDDAATGDYLADTFSRYDEAENGRKMMNDVLAKDPMAPGLFMALSESEGEPGTLVGYLLENYWDEIYNTGSKEEAIEKAKKRDADKAKAAAEDAKKKETFESNLKASDEALTEAANEANVDEANVANMLTWLYGEGEQPGLVHRAITRELDKNDWLKLLHAFNQEKALDAARKEGRREVKNARGAAHRQMETELPTDLGGGASGGGMTREEDPTIAALQRMKPKYK